MSGSGSQRVTLGIACNEEVYAESVHGSPSELNFRVFYREKRHPDAEYIYSPIIKKNNAHNLQPAETFELSQLDNWFFSYNDFEDGGDYSEYDAVSNNSTLSLQNILLNLKWSDFEVSVHFSMIILKRVSERYFTQKTKAESS